MFAQKKQKFNHRTRDSNSGCAYQSGIGNVIPRSQWDYRLEDMYHI